MSLINQVLKDLENRARSPREPSMVWSGSFFSEEGAHALSKIKFFGIIILVLVMMLIGIKQFVTLRATPVVATAVSSAPILLPFFSSKRDNAAIGNKNTHAKITGITMQVDRHITSLRFLLNENVFYRVESYPAKHTLVVVFDHTDLAAGMPALNELQSGLQAMEVQKSPQGTLKLILQIKPHVELQHLNLMQSAVVPAFQIDFKEMTQNY